MKTTRPAASALTALSFLVVAGSAATWLDRPPAMVAASAPPTVFSAERAMRTVSRLAVRPHPTGSLEIQRVRDDLASTLSAMGLQVERQRTVALRSRTAGVVRAARVENLLVRIPGTASTGAVLLATHYDSVPAGPGAADDGSGVGALVEAARAVLAGARPRNDLIFLFTDGEELGLLGAEAFVNQHPWAGDVRVAINFEARGTSGPSQMFETGPANAGVVEEWARSAPSPTGSSLTYEVYKRMPNDTDFSVFRTLGIPGLNFAFVGDWGHYHTPLDSLAHLDRGSLQHHGGTALALARRFGEVDLARRETADLVYFSLPGTGVVVRYSVRLAAAGAAAAVVLLLGVLLLATRQRHSRAGGVLLAAVIVVVCAGLAGFAGFRALRVAEWMQARWLAPGNELLSAPYAAALVAAVAAAWLALYALLRRKFAAPTLALGAAAVLVVLSVVCTWMLPGGSYVTAWPTLALLVAVPLALAGEGRQPAVRVLINGLVLALALPAVAILVPLAVTLFVTMGLAAPSGAAMAVLAFVGLAALTPQVELVTEGRRFWPAVLVLLVGLAATAWGAATTRYTPATPRTADVTYVLDADAHIAHWTARSEQVTPWLAQYLGAAPLAGRPAAFVPPWSTPTGIPGFRQALASVAELPAPHAALVDATSSGEGRLLRFRLTPGAEGHALSVWVFGAPVVGATVGGRAVKPAAGSPPAGDAWSLDFVNAPAEGIELTLDCRGLNPITMAVLDRSAGLPSAAGRFEPRPADIVPDGLGDQTVVRRTFRF